MDIPTMLGVMAVAATLGIILGYFLRYFLTLSKTGSMELQLKKAMLEAKEEAQKIIDAAEKKIEKRKHEAKRELKEAEDKIQRTEDRLTKREELIDKRQQEVDRELSGLRSRIEEAKKLKQRIEDKEGEIDKELERAASLTVEDAKNELMESVEKSHEEDLILRMRKLEVEGREQLDKKARDILSNSIQRYANNAVADIMTSSVTIPSDEIKGKIIGKEGRNIRAFERAAGVELIVDDTPGTVVISSFDPIRRQVARIALENLIMDGRIQPVKIEETIEKAQKDINKIIKEKGEQAAFECGVYNLDPRVISILGRLYFRTSYGQNVLQHSIEMSHIAGMIAEEIGADPVVARAGALLHDIGKAVDHEIQGTHVEIGRRILQKFGVDEKVIVAMQSHHEEYPYETVESMIVQAADAISGGRPGARRDTVENYLKRLTELETIANSFDGVEKTYALQAGREVRVFVTPDAVTDYQALQIARDIASRIESELRYPGEIKVMVIRESRSIEYAR